jgi:hypothetical protein
MCAALVGNAAHAGTALVPQPFQVGEETARYERGSPTLMLERKNGAVALTPLPMDHGSISFAVVVYNDSDRVADFGTTNISATAGDQTIGAFTESELESSAKRRATWSAVGIALLAGVAAGAASQAYTTNHYYGRMRTPHGTYSWRGSYRDNSIGVLGATAATAAGVAGVVSIQDRLSQTLGMLNNEIIQRTTIDPASSYGGRIVMQKIKGTARDVKIAIDWNGETYAFGLHIPKKGDPPLAEVRAAAGSGRMARESDAPGATLDMPPIVAVPAHPVAAALAPANADPVVAVPKS